MKENDMKPTLKTLKRLFALSGNECAMLGCSEPLIDSGHGVIVGEATHIKGEKPRSARYDPDQSEEERCAFENLIAVCRKHHKIFDDQPEIYTVELLTDFKLKHEARFSACMHLPFTKNFVIREQSYHRTAEKEGVDW